MNTGSTGRCAEGKTPLCLTVIKTRFLGHASRTLVTILTANLTLRSNYKFPTQVSFTNYFSLFCLRVVCIALLNKSD
jgi:hypothetical protein